MLRYLREPVMLPRWDLVLRCALTVLGWRLGYWLVVH